MFRSKKKKDNRFYTKHDESLPNLGKITIVVDRETGVNYVQTWIGAGGGITPLLDRDGNVVVEE